MSTNIRSYLIALLAVVSVTLVDFYIFYNYDWLSYLGVGLTQLWVVLLVAVYGGRGPALLTAVISTVSWVFLFISPRFTLTIDHLQDLILCVLYFATAIFTGDLTAKIKAQEQQERENTKRISALYKLAQRITTTINKEEILEAVLIQFQQVFDAKASIWMPSNNQLKQIMGKITENSVDISAAERAYQTSETTGRFTNLYSGAIAQYHPLLTPTHTIGVIGIQIDRNRRLTSEQSVLLATFISQIALSIQREQLIESANQTAMLQESGRLYSILLNSISHELRTPLATIKGASSSLLSTQSNNDVQVELINDIQNSADRLNRLVENLLDMSRLESGHLRLKADWCDIRDLIAVAVKSMNCSSEHPIQITVSPELPLIKIDFGLIEQVLLNLLDNACRYTPDNTRIYIEARQQDQAIELVIADDGEGISDEFLERIFDKFYRLPGSLAGGTGLGLSISRGLVEAHNGTLVAEKRPEGGLQFILKLPLIGTPPAVQEVGYHE